MIGGGAGGLAAAARLAGSGRRVLLVEAGPRVGGKLNRWAVPGPMATAGHAFTFDTGPSLLTLPLVLADLFAAVGRDVRDYLPLVRLDPVSRFVWGDGQTFELAATRAGLLDQVRRLAPDDVAGLERFLAFGKKVWDLSGDLFLSQSPEQALRGDGTFAPGRALAMLTVPLRIGMFRKYAKLVDRCVNNQRLGKCCTSTRPIRGPARFWPRRHWRSFRTWNWRWAAGTCRAGCTRSPRLWRSWRGNWRGDPHQHAGGGGADDGQREGQAGVRGAAGGRDGAGRRRRRGERRRDVRPIAS